MDVSEMANPMYEATKQRVVELYRQVARGEIDPREGAAQIDEKIGGITAVRFNNGKRFTVSNHKFAVSLPYNGGRKQRPIWQLAYAGYLKAQENGSDTPGEVHISETMSTKHHKQGLADLLN